MDELKPCPFCGSDAKIFEYKRTNGWNVICQQPECECNARIPYCHSEEEAIEQWNRRVPNPLTELVKKLRELTRKWLPGMDYYPANVQADALLEKTKFFELGMIGKRRMK